MLYLLSHIILRLLVVLSIAFFTLLERKVISYIQSRKGPKKIRIFGILQPISDALKLLFKDKVLIKSSKLNMMIFGPMFVFFIMLLKWKFLISYYKYLHRYMMVIILILFMRLGVYSLLMTGWGRNSKYAILGSLRGVAQRISYEVSFIFLILFSVLLRRTYKLWNFWNMEIIFFFFFPFVLVIWILIIICETNRAPFDFAEGERELVSGFNIEYGSFFFALLFLGEYGMILFLRYFISVLIVRNFLLKVIIRYIMRIRILWVRGTFPRLRYDFLMDYCWKGVLFFRLFLLFFRLIF